ncbi:MAG TPA: hypothetical protein VGR76_19430 [Candidatus Angelobacter sp.]|nr:hypothetical protein [Candidatus Angelobacter sp.]
MNRRHLKRIEQAMDGRQARKDDPSKRERVGPSTGSVRSGAMVAFVRPFQ